MQDRPKLRTIELTQGRALFRRIVLGALPVLAVVAALGYVLPAHQIDPVQGFHSNFHDGGPLSLFVLGGVAVATMLLGRIGFGAGFGAGVAAMIGAVIALAPVFLVHLFQHVEQGPGETLFALGELGLFFTGAIAIIAEPIVYLFERRRIVRATLPAELPTARAVI